MSFDVTPDLQMKVIKDFGAAISLGKDWHGAVARLIENHRQPDRDPTRVDAERLARWAAGQEMAPDWVWDAMETLCGIRAGMLSRCTDELLRIKHGLGER